MDKLAGRVAVVTGASRGLGRASAALLSLEGARVVLAARSRDEIEQNAADLRAEGLEAVAHPCDVSDPLQVQDLARFAIRTYGQFDIWVNNAASAGPYGATLALSPDQFLDVLHTNILGTYYGSMVAMRHFLPRQSGKLINILGAGSRRPVANQNAYGSSKAWIRVFTLALAQEYRPSGVGVFTLQPGLMKTDLLTRLVTFAPYEARLRRVMPFLVRAAGRDPAVPARKVVWLASAATDGRTGLDLRTGSLLSFLAGSLRESLRQLLHLPAREIPMDISILPSAFAPFPASDDPDDK